MSLGFPVDACPLAGSRRITRAAWLLTGVVCLTQGGCTALISTTSLRDALMDAQDTVVDVDADDPATVVTDDDADTAPVEPLVLVRPAAAAKQTIEEAIERLAEAGRLDDSAQTALISMLEKAPQEDWPTIIDAFIDALDTSHVVAKPVTPTTPTAAAEDSPVVAPREAAATRPAEVAASAEPALPGHEAAPAATLEPPPALPAAETGAPLLFPTADVGSAPVEPPAVIEPAATIVPIEPPSRPTLAVANACFATRVRGWGAVDRFATTRFRPGQDVIVYFELENLESRATESGHTTRIDSSLRLVTDDGRTLHDWSFEPVEETCPARRRDYFARYVLRLPADAPHGGCRLEVSVTDTVADCTAVTSLPLEIATEERP